MKKIIFSSSALNQITLFKSGQQNLGFKIFELIIDVQNTPFTGIGKPEPLKENLKGY